MSEALKHLIIQNTAEINKQIKRLEKIQKNLMKGLSKKDGKQIMEDNAQFHEIDMEISKLKYSLKGVSRENLSTPDDVHHSSFQKSVPTKPVFGFKL